MSAEEKTSMVKRMSALRPRFKQESDLKSIDIILSALKPQK
jgi:hypothetical protein